MKIITGIIAILFLISGCTTSSINERTLAYEPSQTGRLNLELGLAYMENNDNIRALKRLQKAIKADPKYAEAHNGIAILYARLGENDRAGTHYKIAIQLAPEDPRALNNYGQFLCTQGQREKAETMFTRALENPLYQTPQFAHLNAGICAKKASDLEQAEIHFRAALKRDPYLASALYQMADLSHSLKRDMSARAYIERYAATTQHNAKSLWLAIRIENTLGNLDAEASYALHLKNHFPDAQETRLLLKMEGK